MEDQDRRYAPPKTRVDDVGRQPVSREPPERLTRLWARLLDGIILGVAWFILMTIVRVATPWHTFGQPERHWWAVLLLGLLSVALFLALNGYLLFTRGQTLGKAIFKIRIARPDGAIPSFWVRLVILRSGILDLASLLAQISTASLLGGFSWSILVTVVDALFIFGKSRRCLHDLIAGTVVLRA